ncbi:MAG: hypothetical protein IT425_03895 [Pirellulales bacterium]|nr:hypothetical protein [Pirellulales bacterium]
MPCPPIGDPEPWQAEATNLDFVSACYRRTPRASCILPREIPMKIKIPLLRADLRRS